MLGVLVVDDDPYLREATRDILMEEGYAGGEAPDGLAALDLLRAADAPMVVLLDIVMPAVSGIDVLTLIGGDERLARHEYIIWAASRVPLPGELLEELAVPVLPKPFDVEALVARVADAARRLEREASA
jgi:CheY-like chemotaxis protein